MRASVQQVVPDEVSNGTTKKINQLQRIYYDGYWIRHYDVPNSLSRKKILIDQLARRVFHHTEPGINTPGDKLEEVRKAYEEEQVPSKKRVLAAMLAGALLNRGVDILTKVVELEEMGITIEENNELIKMCGRCFMGALEYGKYIRPVRGKEGLDELWGEPFKAFTMPLDKFYENRYIKIAQSMKGIDSIADKLDSIFINAKGFESTSFLIKELAESCKQVTETMRSDPAMIEIWPKFVSAADQLSAFRPVFHEEATIAEKALGRRGRDLIVLGGDVMVNMANMRIPLPETTTDFLKRCDDFLDKYQSRLIQT